MLFVALCWMYDVPVWCCKQQSRVEAKFPRWSFKIIFFCPTLSLQSLHLGGRRQGTPLYFHPSNVVLCETSQQAHRGGKKARVSVKKERAFNCYDHTRPPHIPATDIYWLLNFVPAACQNFGEEFLSSRSSQNISFSNMEGLMGAWWVVKGGMCACKKVNGNECVERKWG